MDTPVTLGPISLTPAVIAAIASIIGAGVSFGIAIWNTRKARDLETLKNTFAQQLQDRKNVLDQQLQDHENVLDQALEAYKNTLTEKQEERRARREYQYEARKHLYQQYEPLLFQLVECCESAKERIFSLARTARLGDLGSRGWLSNRDGYYFYSTIYFLLSPLVIFKIMQRSVTFVDLTVDRYINDQYLLAKQLAWSFTDAFDFAKIAPKIDYDPDAASTAQQLEQYPEKFWPQGIYVGMLDKAVEACIKRDPDGVSRCMSFGEFEEAYKKKETLQNFENMSTIFLYFHPKTRPVLWRMLITQAHINESLLSTRQIKLASLDEKSTPKLAIKPLTSDTRQKLDWRQSPDEATDEEVLVQPFEVARMYLCRENSFVKHLVEK
jgi:hypothetical protein